MSANKSQNMKRKFTSQWIEVAIRAIIQSTRVTIVLMLVFLSLLTGRVFAQDQQQQPPPQKSLEVYGFAMLDMGYDFKQINPNWYDALRVTKLPTYKDQYAPDGKVFFGVRQTRFGVRGYTPTAKGDLKVVFEFDMFGVGGDEGQTTMRLRHAYGEIGKLAVGQTNTPFMDGDVWPNTIEYWGPTGMVFFRNILIRYAPIKTDTKELFIALERPGASADQGTFSGRTELDSVRGHFNVPDLSVHFKKSGKWGHVQLAGMLRSIKWTDIHKNGGYDISGSVTGWGLHLSTVLNVAKTTTFRGSVVYGEGIQNYMNDAPVDVGIIQTGDSRTPVEGKALPVTGIVGWFDHNWNDTWWSSLGYSSTSIDNTQYASATAYKMGQYAMLTIGTTPFKNTMAAIEFQWGKRESFNGFKADDTKVQLSFKYNFSETFFTKKGGQE
jgi:hypothetical protein